MGIAKSCVGHQQWSRPLRGAEVNSADVRPRCSRPLTSTPDDEEECNDTASMAMGCQTGRAFSDVLERDAGYDVHMQAATVFEARIKPERGFRGCVTMRSSPAWYATSRSTRIRTPIPESGGTCQAGICRSQGGRRVDRHTSDDQCRGQP